MNKIALISGASSGIGAATAVLLSNNGFDIILCGRNQKALEDIQNQLSNNSNSIILNFDVRHNDEIINAIQNLPEAFRTINVLINNAGNAHGLSSVQEADLKDWDAMIDTNVKGLLYLSKAVIPLMEKQEFKHIINIGSIAGKEVYPKGNVYCASKFAVDAINRGMRYDLYEHGFRISEVNPGLVETGFSNVRFKGDTKRAEKVYEGYQALKAEDIADLILYILNAPPHVNIAETLILPSAQAASTMVKKDI